MCDCLRRRFSCSQRIFNQLFSVLLVPTRVVAETGLRGADHLGPRDWVIDCEQPTGCWPDGEKMHNAMRIDK